MTGAGAVGLPSSSRPRSGADGRPASPPFVREILDAVFTKDTCQGCGTEVSILDFYFFNYGTRRDPDWRRSRLCMTCAIDEGAAVRGGLDAADVYESPPSAQEAEDLLSASGGATPRSEE